MAAVIITKKDLKKLGNELLKELYNFFNDEYMLTHSEVKKEGIRFIKNLITAEFKENNYSLIERELPMKNSKYEISKRLECLKDRIKNDAISLDVIIQAIKQIEYKNGLNEIDQDLHGKVGSFKNLYYVYSYDHSYLI